MACSAWVDVVVGGGRWLKMRLGLKESRFSRRRWVYVCCVRVWMVINLQVGVAVGIMLLHSEAFHDAPPHPHHPEPPGPSFILIYELPHGHSALLYHLCIDPSRSTRCSTAAQIDIGGGVGV